MNARQYWLRTIIEQYHFSFSTFYDRNVCLSCATVARQFHIIVLSTVRQHGQCYSALQLEYIGSCQPITFIGSEGTWAISWYIHIISFYLSPLLLSSLPFASLLLLCLLYSRVRRLFSLFPLSVSEKDSCLCIEYETLAHVSFLLLFRFSSALSPLCLLSHSPSRFASSYTRWSVAGT